MWLSGVGFLGVETQSRVGAGVERMRRGWGPCGRPLRMRRTHGHPLTRHDGQPQGPQPLRDAPRHGTKPTREKARLPPGG